MFEFYCMDNTELLGIFASDFLAILCKQLSTQHRKK